MLQQRDARPPIMSPPQGDAGKVLQQRDAELQARSHQINDLKTTVALLHARIEHHQQQTITQVGVAPL